MERFPSNETIRAAQGRLKYAIEALGGEYDEPRDFSDDKDYIAVEAAAAKASVNKDETVS